MKYRLCGNKKETRRGRKTGASSIRCNFIDLASEIRKWWGHTEPLTTSPVVPWTKAFSYTSINSNKFAEENYELNILIILSDGSLHTSSWRDRTHGHTSTMDKQMYYTTHSNKSGWPAAHRRKLLFSVQYYSVSSLYVCESFNGCSCCPLLHTVRVRVYTETCVRVGFASLMLFFSARLRLQLYRLRQCYL